MDRLSSAVGSLRAGLGLPTNDVNTAQGSSPAQSTQQSPASDRQSVSPASQSREAAEIIRQATEPRQPEPPSDDRGTQAKDEAITDLRARLEHSQKSQEELNAKLTQLMEATMPKKQEPQEDPLPEMPEMPEGITADEALKLLYEHQKRYQESVNSRIQKRDEALKGLLGPIVNEVKETAAYKDRMNVLERYPNFDYDAHKDEMDALRYQVRGLTQLEAAQLVALKHDRHDMLKASEPAAPAVEASLPSVRSATTQPSAPVANEPNAEDTKRSLQNAVVNLHQQGKGLAANQVIDQLLRMKGYGLNK